MVSVISNSLTGKMVNTTTWSGTCHARKSTGLNNMILTAVLNPAPGARVDIYVRSKSMIAGVNVPLHMKLNFINTTPGDEHYVPKEYPVRISDSNAVRLVYEAADIDSSFIVTAVFHSGGDSELKIELNDA